LIENNGKGVGDDAFVISHQNFWLRLIVVLHFFFDSPYSGRMNASVGLQQRKKVTAKMVMLMRIALRKLLLRKLLLR